MTESDGPSRPRVRERLWLWAHQAGSHNGQYGLPAPSSIAPAEAARSMDLDNVIMACYGDEPAPPLAPHAEPMRGLERLVWSIVGDTSSTRNDQQSDLEAVVSLAEQFPNVTGAMMDDFFLGEVAPDGRQARYLPRDVRQFRDRLHQATHPLDLWVVVYDRILDRPLGPHLDLCDVVTFWTWKAAELDKLADNFARLEQVAPAARKLLGCYMWDYGVGGPMPLEQMQRQCETALAWLRAGRIEGIIFLASCLCDLEVETVAWTRRWIARVGDELL